MAGIKLTNTENDIALRALSLYLWYLNQPRENRPAHKVPLEPREEEDERIHALGMYGRAYRLRSKQQGF